MNVERAASHDAAAMMTEAVVNAAAALDVNQATIAKCLGISTASVSRMMGQDAKYHLAPNRGEWDAAAHFIRLYRNLGSILDNNQGQMRAWLHSPNRELYSVPMEILKTPMGLYRLVMYLDAYRGLI